MCFRRRLVCYWSTRPCKVPLDCSQLESIGRSSGKGKGRKTNWWGGLYKWAGIRRRWLEDRMIPRCTCKIVEEKCCIAFDSRVNQYRKVFKMSCSLYHILSMSTGKNTAGEGNVSNLYYNSHQHTPPYPTKYTNILVSTNKLTNMLLGLRIAEVRDIAQNLLSLLTAKSLSNTLLLIPSQDALGNITARRVELHDLPLLQTIRGVLPSFLDHGHVCLEVAGGETS